MELINEHAELEAEIEQLTDIIEQKKKHAAELKQRAHALKETLQRSNPSKNSKILTFIY